MSDYIYYIISPITVETVSGLAKTERNTNTREPQERFQKRKKECKNSSIKPSLFSVMDRWKQDFLGNGFIISMNIIHLNLSEEQVLSTQKEIFNAFISLWLYCWTDWFRWKAILIRKNGHLLNVCVCTCFRWLNCVWTLRPTHVWSLQFFILFYIFLYFRL